MKDKTMSPMDQYLQAVTRRAVAVAKAEWLNSEDPSKLTACIPEIEEYTFNKTRDTENLGNSSSYMEYAKLCRINKITPVSSGEFKCNHNLQNKIPYIITVDYDDTIATTNGGIIYPEAEAVRELYKLGCCIIINTCRTGKMLGAAIDNLDSNDIKYHYINDQHPVIKELYTVTDKDSNVTCEVSTKLFSHIDIDTNSIYFTGPNIPKREKILRQAIEDIKSKLALFYPLDNNN